MSADPRPIWKGVLQIRASFAVPVRMLSASEPAAGVAFNQAHQCTRTTLTRIKQKKWCPTCQAEVPQPAIVRVFEHATGQYLKVTDAELEACEEATSTAILVTAVVDDPVTPLFIETTAYLVGDGPGAAAALEPVRLALGTRMAVGTMVLHKRTVRVALQAGQTGLIVYVLRSRDQVRELDAPALVPFAPPRAQVAAARDLLAALSGRCTYDPIDDAYATRVRAMLVKKITQQNPRLTKQLARRRRRKAS